MPEPTKRGGFHALEQRIHQLEEEDAKQQKSGAETQSASPDAAPRDEKRRDERKA